MHQFDRDPASVANVIKAIVFIGSLYMLDPTSQSHRVDLETAALNDLPPNGFNVQCLLLFAAALEWSGEQDYGRIMLDRAKSMALDIGMQSREFAAANGLGCAALEESWRRTWWELYIIDSIFAGIRHLSTFDLWHVDCSTALPCEEDVYIQGVS
jgi:hypothetical protein